MKAVCLLSGGLDSTVLLGLTQDEGYDPIALSVIYGQRHVTEIAAAREVARFYKVPHFVVDLGDSLKPILKGSALTDASVEVPEGHYAAENMALTVVPNRNAILLSLATALAVSQGAEVVRFGAHAGDHAIYPDCREEFVTPFSDAMRAGNQPATVVVEGPFLHISKTDIVRMGYDLGAPFELTWSCYKGGAKHCGRCGTCVERRLAFEDADLSDPVEFEDPTYAFQVKAPS
jgi:7-cyano-7-deazaguanine synthase